MYSHNFVSYIRYCYSLKVRRCESHIVLVLSNVDVHLRLDFFGGSGDLVDGIRIHSFSMLMLNGSIKFESSELSCTFVFFVKGLSLSAELLRVQCLYRS